MVVRCGEHSAHLDLRDRAPRAGRADTSHCDIALDDLEHIGHRRVMCLRNERLGARIRDRPQRRHRLGYREGQVEARGRRDRRLRSFLRLDPRSLLLPLITGKRLGQSLQARRDTFGLGRERAVGPTKLLTRGGVLPMPEQSLELLLAYLVTRRERLSETGKPRAIPATGRGGVLGVAAFVRSHS